MKSHENSSADCTLRPRGVGAAGSTLSYDRIVRPDVLWRAWEEVRANRGRPGIDGVSIEDVERHGVETYPAQLAADLRAERYRPSPVLRVEIPKPDGRMRPLGIPTVRDRVVQQAARIVIEPIFETNFLECSTRVSSPAQRRPGGPGGQGGAGPRLGGPWCRHRGLLRPSRTTGSSGVSSGGASATAGCSS